MPGVAVPGMIVPGVIVPRVAVPRVVVPGMVVPGVVVPGMIMPGVIVPVVVPALVVVVVAHASPGADALSMRVARRARNAVAARLRLSRIAAAWRLAPGFDDLSHVFDVAFAIVDVDQIVDPER